MRSQHAVTRLGREELLAGHRQERLAAGSRATCRPPRWRPRSGPAGRRAARRQRRRRRRPRTAPDSDARGRRRRVRRRPAGRRRRESAATTAAAAASSARQASGPARRRQPVRQRAARRHTRPRQLTRIGTSTRLIARPAVYQRPCGHRSGGSPHPRLLERSTGGSSGLNSGAPALRRASAERLFVGPPAGVGAVSPCRRPRPRFLPSRLAR